MPSSAMEVDGASRCLEGVSCKVRDADDLAGQCDASVHSCVTCGGAMHAICGLAAPGEEEGYGSKRLCSSCSDADNGRSIGDGSDSGGSAPEAGASLGPSRQIARAHPSKTKPRCISNLYVDIMMDGRGRKMARERCCPSSKYKLHNVSRSKKHMMSCPAFGRKYPAALEALVSQVSGYAAAEDLRRRRVDAPVDAAAAVGAKRDQPVVSAVQDRDTMLPHIAVTSVERRDKLNELFADGIILEGLPFNHGARSGFLPFWKEAFRGTWKPPSDHFATDHLGEVYRVTRDEVMSILRSPPSLGASIDGFSDVNSKSVFNFMAGGPVPFVFETFRLRGERESAVNIDSIVAGIVEVLSKETEQKVIGFVSDSPNVMILARKLICGEKGGGSACCAFAYGCSCHGLSNHVRDV